MINLRFSGIAAGLAFILSFIFGLMSGINMPILLLRALMFGFLFFVVSACLRLVIGRFLPELLEGGGTTDDSGLSPGSRVNISESDGFPGDDSYGGVSGANADIKAAIPKPETGGEEREELGNIADLYIENAASPSFEDGDDEYRQVGEMAQTGLDQKTEEDYNKPGSIGGKTTAAASAKNPPRNGSPPGKADAGTSGFSADYFGGTADDLLPDLDSMAGAFKPASVIEETDTIEYSVSTPSRAPASRKNETWAGDFNAKDMAKGLQTVLNKEKEG